MTYSLTISAGTGPIEVRQFVAALARQCDGVASVVEGEPEAPRSITLLLHDPPTLDIGSHVLVATSRHRAGRARKRWYAGVWLEPEPPNAQALRITDIRFQRCLAGGPGGQHAQKNQTAVRATHVPSGLRVKVRDQRSAAQNQAAAIKLLRLALHRRAERARQLGARASRRQHYVAVRQPPVATWTLDPRTGDLHRV